LEGLAIFGRPAQNQTNGTGRFICGSGHKLLFFKLGMLSANAVPITAHLELQANAGTAGLSFQWVAVFLAHALHQFPCEKVFG
jgi:hypothetical protein